MLSTTDLGIVRFLSICQVRLTYQSSSLLINIGLCLETAGRVFATLRLDRLATMVAINKEKNRRKTSRADGTTMLMKIISHGRQRYAVFHVLATMNIRAHSRDVPRIMSVLVT